MKNLVVFLICIFIAIQARAQDDLLHAVATGDKAKLEALIAGGADVKGADGGRALYRAVLLSNLETVEVLVERGADVNSREPQNGYTPLHVAVSYAARAGGPPPARNGKLPPMDATLAETKNKIAELLIKHGANVNDGSKYGVTPLHKAATKELAELLIKYGANVNAVNINNGAPIFDAVGHGIDVVETLIAHGADVNNKDKSGYTPLNLALRMNDKSIAELLIKHGADVNIKDQNGHTLVENAFQNNNQEFVALLMEHGAKVATDSYNGRTGLNMAVGSGSPQMAELMLKNGGRTDDMDRSGRTSLFFAVEGDEIDVATLLIKNKADVNLVTREGIPLLHAARSKEMMELLLDNGADVNVRDSKGDSLLWHVGYDLELAAVLLKRGADINISNNHGQTILHLAASFARDKVAKWLVKHGTDVNARDDQGRTPLFPAVESFERYSTYAPTSGIQGKAVPMPAIRQQPGMTMGAGAISSGVGGIAVIQSGKESDQTAHVKTKAQQMAERASEQAKIDRASDLNNAYPVGMDTSNSKAVVKLLLAHKADVQATDVKGQNLLHIAPTLEIVNLLLKHKVNVNAKRSDGTTPLFIAVDSVKKEIVRALLSHGADVNAANNDGLSPLHVAAEAEIAKLLVKRHANVNAIAKDGTTPLHWATKEEVVKLLLDHGANASAADNNGMTPLHGAETAAVVDTLIQHGAVLNATNKSGQTPLLYSIRTYLRKLLEVGVKKSPTGGWVMGETVASDQGIKALIANGAMVNLSDNNGYMPLFFVREAMKDRAYGGEIDSLRVIENLLLANGAKLEREEGKGNQAAPQQQYPTPAAGVGAPQKQDRTIIIIQ